MTRAGLPAIIKLSPNDLVTVELAPTMTLLPKVTPGRITEPPPTQTSLPKVTGFPVPQNLPAAWGPGDDRLNKFERGVPTYSDHRL